MSPEAKSQLEETLKKLQAKGLLNMGERMGDTAPSTKQALQPEDLAWIFQLHNGGQQAQGFEQWG